MAEMVARRVFNRAGLRLGPGQGSGEGFRKLCTAPFINPPSERDIDGLVEFFQGKSSIVAITGAGISTASGIPDYRGPEGSYRKGHVPIKHQEFIKHPASRQRYWLRSMHGWPRLSQSRPNAAHLAVAQLEAMGRVSGVVTQNVDRLHQQAGSVRIVDLHGRIDQVVCLECRAKYSRRHIQDQLSSLNPELAARIDTQAAQRMRADGDLDVQLADGALEAFRVPCCAACGGVLKPDVVFFGDNVPAQTVETATAMVDGGDGVLVVGSSLEVFSAYRFVTRAASRGLPIAIINFGETRAERQQVPTVCFKSEAQCTALLQSALQRLDSGFGGGGNGVTV